MRSNTVFERFVTRTGLGAAMLAVMATVACAPGAVAAKEAERKPVVDPRTDQVLRDMSKYLAARKRFTVRADVAFDEVLPTGQKVQYAAVQHIAVRRPNRVYVDYEGDLGENRLWYDGKRLTLLDEDDNVYASVVVPTKIDAMLDQVLAKHGFAPPLADLIYSDPYAVLHPRVQFGLYLGPSQVDGVRCHHLAFVDKDIDWQVWVEDGEHPLPRKLVITYTQVSGAPQYQARLSEWNFSVDPPDSVFEPTLPPGAAQLELVEVVETAKKK